MSQENSGRNIGRHIRRYLAEHPEITQEVFAEKLGVSRQTLASWITRDHPADPRTEQLPAIAEALGTTISLLYTDPNTTSWFVKEKMYQESHMYTRLKTYAEMEGLSQFNRALSYANDLHRNQKRYGNRFAEKRFDPVTGEEIGIPYIVHPLMMACHAHALGIIDDEVLASCMLHDVCEDCGVKVEELPFSEEVKEIVALLTKDPEHKHDPGYNELYYGAIMKNPKASIVKALDRCNNVSTMAGSFKHKKLAEYVRETETYVYPLLDYIKENYIEYCDAVFTIKYHIMSILETVKCMMLAAGNIN
ncbi:MAG: helix-turn-helix domain-containing protein [Eubacterium sp.]|nr:helix-turn-helix domain-containing protein [Eubacterium sp.]